MYVKHFLVSLDAKASVLASAEHRFQSIRTAIFCLERTTLAHQYYTIFIRVELPAPGLDFLHGMLGVL